MITDKSIQELFSTEPIHDSKNEDSVDERIDIRMFAITTQEQSVAILESRKIHYLAQLLSLIQPCPQTRRNLEDCMFKECLDNEVFSEEAAFVENNQKVNL